MPTQKLYYRDPYLHTFAAQVVATKPGWLALDQTAFYPEGGGQPADHGWLQDSRVTDVQMDEQGVIWHRVDLETEVGAQVEGRIDWLRRFCLLYTSYGNWRTTGSLPCLLYTS